MLPFADDPIVDRPGMAVTSGPGGTIMTAVSIRAVNQAVVETLVQGAFNQSFKIADDVAGSIDNALEHLARGTGGTGYGSDFQRSMIAATVSARNLQFPGAVGASHVDEGIKLLRGADDLGSKMSDLHWAAYRADDRAAGDALAASANELMPQTKQLLESARTSFGLATQDARDAAEGVVHTLLN